MKERLILGTVQFGLNYGVANMVGRIDLVQARSILDLAYRSNITMLDTAIAYGESEETLGSIGLERWQVITKLPAIPEACSDVTKWVNDQTAASMKRLGIGRLDGLLLHRPDQLLEDRGAELYEALLRLREQGAVKRIGISIYSPEQLNDLFDGMNFEIVQAPLNILDRRIISSGWAARLKLMGVEVHARSVFLQGLLLMEATQRPQYFNQWLPLWNNWDAWLKANNTSPLNACLSFVMSIPDIDKIVVGVDGANHLKEIIDALQPESPVVPDWQVDKDSKLVNPSLWELN
jgi:aryl-alcohol dehydrogenase-like predicted oxidoreductase